MFIAPPLTGTASQIEWAEQIRPRVDEEFARVERAFRETADKQPEALRPDTLAVIDILRTQHAAVMGRFEAGYFIKEWQELGDQVRQLIFRDPAYTAIRERREARKLAKGLSAV
jgi:hypothetical protein